MKKILFAFLLVGVNGTCHAAFQEFYMISGGSDTNSGSTTDLAAPVATTNGSWASPFLNRFVAASGTPFSGTSVGQFAAISSDSATGAVYVSSIVAVDAGGTYIDVDTTTIAWGTAPSASTIRRTCKIGGAWAGRPVIVSLFASKTVPTSTRVNIKAGTYANAANIVTFGSSGGNGNLLWWRGYKTTPGDQDTNANAVAGTDIPIFTFTTTGEMTVSGANQIFSNIVSSCNVTSGTSCLDPRAANLTFYRFRVYNSSTAATGIALAQNSAASNLLLQSCYIQASTVATNALQNSGSAQDYVIGCTIVGGSTTVSGAGAGSLFYRNFVYASGVHAFNVGNVGGIYLDNSIYGPGGDGFRIPLAPTQGVVIVNNYLENVNGANSTAAINLVVSSNTLHISGNAYYNCTLNKSTSILEGFAPYDNGTLTDSAFTSPTTQNFSLKPVGKNIAFPSTFENLPNMSSSYLDVGAAQATRDSSFTFGN